MEIIFNRKSLLICPFLLVLLISSCKHEPDEFIPPPGNGDDPTPVDTTVNCDPDTVYFQNDILPLLVSNCSTSGCHDEETASDGVILTGYYQVIETGDVDPFDPDNSEIYEKIVETDPDKRMPPPPNDPLSQEQKGLVYKWIQQGALNNYCDDIECDSTNVSFSETVWPIVQNSCFGCHSGANPDGGISLENYNDVKAVGESGQLYGVIAYLPGYVPMPKNGSQLSDCKIAQIKNWINNGMPNN